MVYTEIEVFSLDRERTRLSGESGLPRVYVAALNNLAYTVLFPSSDDLPDLIVLNRPAGRRREQVLEELEEVGNRTGVYYRASDPPIEFKGTDGSGGHITV